VTPTAAPAASATTTAKTAAAAASAASGAGAKATPAKAAVAAKGAKDSAAADGGDDDEAFDFGAKKKKPAAAAGKAKSVAFAPTVQTKKFSVPAEDDDDDKDGQGDDGDDGDDDDDVDVGDDDVVDDDNAADISFADEAGDGVSVTSDSATSTTPAAPVKEKKPAAWLGTTRDYAYDELVDRIFDLLHADRPELADGRKKYQMKPPRVCREGTKKTVWVNFPDMCRSMHRPGDHVQEYVLAELGLFCVC
jgi:hypothetical protein